MKSQQVYIRELVRRLPIRLDPYLLILAALPALVLFRNSNPVFTPIGTIDPWVYHGFFHNLVSFKRDLFPGTYYGSRLAWILPGYVLYQIFPPLVANYVLHLSVYYIAVFSLFSLLKTATDRQTALLGATLFGFYPYFWAAAGWDYVDGAGIAWFLLTMLLLTRAAAAPRPYITLIAAGCGCAALVYTNLAWSLLCPAFALYYVPYRRVQRNCTLIKPVLEMGTWFSLGIGLVTIVFALINHPMDGAYWFYFPSVAYAFGAVKRTNPWARSSAEWLEIAYWLIFPSLAVLLSVLVLARARKMFFARKNVVAGLFVAQFLFAAAMMLWLQYTGDPLLQFPYYASYLIPFTFLVIGSQYCHVPQFSRHAFSILVVSILVVLTLPWWNLTTALWHTLLPLSIAGFAAIAGLAFVGRKAGLISFLVGTGVFYAYLVTPDYNPNAARGSFVRINLGIREIERVRHSRLIRFWFDAGEPFGREFHSLNSTYLWGYTMMSATFPAYSKDLDLQTGTLVVVPSSRGNAAEEAVRSFRSNGKILNPLSRAPVFAEGGGYVLSFFEVVTDPSKVQELTVSFGKDEDGTLSIPSSEAHTPLPQERWTPSSGTAALTREHDGLRVKTPDGAWAYATIYSPLTVPANGRYRFSLGYRMLSGHMYFGVLKGDQSGWLTGATASNAVDADMRVECSLTLKRGEKIWLLTTNEEPNTKQPSSYIIEDLHAFRYIDP